MNYEIVNLEEMIVSGIGTTTCNKQGLKDIGQLWSKFLNEGEIEKIPNQTDHKFIGLYTDYEGDESAPYYFMCGVGVKESFGTYKVIPKGKYVKFSKVGKVPDIVGELWQAVYLLDVERDFTVDFELYHNENGDPTYQQVDLYISVK